MLCEVSAQRVRSPPFTACAVHMSTSSPAQNIIPKPMANMGWIAVLLMILCLNMHRMHWHKLQSATGGGGCGLADAFITSPHRPHRLLTQKTCRPCSLTNQPALASRPMSKLDILRSAVLKRSQTSTPSSPASSPLSSPELKERSPQPVATTDALPVPIKLSPREKVCAVISSHVLRYPAQLLQVTWTEDRCEVVVDSMDAAEGLSLSAMDLESLQTAISAELEADSSLTSLLTNTEILLATPGVSDILTTDRDFCSFQGFDVQVTYQDKLTAASLVLQGSLVGRDATHVQLSLKGRQKRIRRTRVLEVRLPPSLFEDDDPEIHKLR